MSAADGFKPDPQMPGWHVREGEHAREYMPSWIVEAGRKNEALFASASQNRIELKPTETPEMSDPK